LGRREIDLVLAAGDITIPGHEAYATDFVRLIARHNLPLLLVHGNNDRFEAVEQFRTAGVTIHRRERELFGRRFVGFGGDGNAPYDVELADGERATLSVEGAIFLTHLPPATRMTLAPVDGEEVPRYLTFGADKSSVTGVGPLAHICGHIHHTEGVGYLAGTKVVKLRAAMWNRCALLNLKTLHVEFADLDLPNR
jgi:Icc-related predicted phosphoesterase